MPKFEELSTMEMLEKMIRGIIQIEFAKRANTAASADKAINANEAEHAKNATNAEYAEQAGNAETAGYAENGGVKSVNGLTGDVNLTKNQLGLGDVDNVRQYSAKNPPPEATQDDLGTVKLGIGSICSSRRDTFSGVAHGRTYPVQKDADGRLVVCVPWGTMYTYGSLDGRYQYVTWDAGYGNADTRYGLVIMTGTCASPTTTITLPIAFDGVDAYDCVARANWTNDHQPQRAYVLKISGSKFQFPKTTEDMPYTLIAFGRVA